jgi:hypothetical protein
MWRARETDGLSHNDAACGKGQASTQQHPCYSHSLGVAAPVVCAMQSGLLAVHTSTRDVLEALVISSLCSDALQRDHGMLPSLTACGGCCAGHYSVDHDVQHYVGRSTGVTL